MENKKEIDVAKKQPPAIPGIGSHGEGFAGMVICPFMSITHPGMCLKQGCELWTELNCGEIKVARCALAWLPVISVEIRQSIDKITKPAPTPPG